MASGERTTLYLLNEENQIEWVGGGWDAFARQNGAPELQGTAVLHRSIFSFISDPTTNQVYRALYRRVREGHLTSVPLRCDGPSIRREIRLDLQPLPAGYIECAVVTTSAVTTPVIPLWLAPSGSERSVVTACGWCKRVRVGPEWREVAEAVAELALASWDRPGVSHGMCPACQAAAIRIIRN